MTNAKQPQSTGSADLKPPEHANQAEQAKADDFKPSSDSIEDNIDETDAFSVPEASVTDLQTEIETLKQQVTHWQTQCKYHKANEDNARKRAEQEITKIRQFGNQNLLKALLSVLDSMEKGLESCSDETKAHAIAGPIAEGLQLTFTLMLETLAKEGLEKVSPLNETFDPNFHEAIGTQTDTGLAPNTVSQVLQTGYRLKERALRPALVMVAK